MIKNRLMGIMTVVIAILLIFLLTACGTNGGGGNSGGDEGSSDISGGSSDTGGGGSDMGGGGSEGSGGSPDGGEGAPDGDGGSGSDGGIDNPDPGGTWGTAGPVETGDTGDASYPQIAFDSGGNAIAVWHQYDGSRYSIYANRYIAGIGWGDEELIETDSTVSALYPQIAVDSGGNAIAIWYQYDGSRDSIYANRYVAGMGWGTAESIETGDTGDASYPQIAFDSGGNAIAVWHQYDGSSSNIHANRYVTDKGWGEPEIIESDTGDALYPQIAVDAGGNAIAIWYQYDGSRYSIYANRYVVDHGWDMPELVETSNTGEASSPQIAFDADGNAIAVWYQHDGLRYSIYARRYVAGTGWEGYGRIETYDSGDASSPQIAVDAGGNAIAVWHQSDGSGNNIYANRYVAGEGWGAAVRIDADGSGDASSPRIAVDAGGNAIAVWYQYDGTRNNINANRYVAGEGWGAAARIDADGSGDASFPQIAFAQDGSAFAVWHQYDGLRYSIYANGYN